jgi:integrase
LADLCEWWLAHRCPPARVYNERCRIKRHVLDSKLGQIPVKLVTSEAIEVQLVSMERQGYSPKTINGLRGTLGTLFNRARKARIWMGINPTIDVQPREVPRRIHATLRAEEIPLVMAHVPLDWRPIFMTALYTGMRKGEILGLRKQDVDLANRLVTVARSYEATTTKGKHADIIPIAEPLLPVFEAAMEASPCELMFPDSEGRMRGPETDPQLILRHALGRAGLVDGYEHVCRRCAARGKPHLERQKDAEPRRCPECNMKLWPRALPRQMRFHDLRHSTATLLIRAGVDLHRVQRILRHKDSKLTSDTYAHLEVEDLRDAVNRIAPRPTPRPPDQQP